MYVAHNGGKNSYDGYSMRVERDSWFICRDFNVLLRD